MNHIQRLKQSQNFSLPLAPNKNPCGLIMAFSLSPSKLLVILLTISSGLLIKSIKGVDLRPDSLLACPFNPKWFRCPSSKQCISPNQLCDGVVDCMDSTFDEDAELCAKLSCDNTKELRCKHSQVCVRLPHRHICNERNAVCPDGSDQAFCLHKIFTGCLLHTDLGLKLSDCNQCLCHLKAPNNNNNNGQDLNRAWIFKSVSNTHYGSHVVGNVCIGPNSYRVCNGIRDCVNGEDEMNCSGHRQGKHLAQEKDLDKKGPEDKNKDGSEEKKDSDKIDNKEKPNNTSVNDDTVMNLLFGQNLSNLVPSATPLWLRNFLASNKKLSILAIMSPILLLILIVLCLHISICIFCKRGKSKDREPILEHDLVSLDTASDLRPASSINTQDSNRTKTTTITNNNAAIKMNYNWSWNNASVVRSLGSGVHGRVYLARENCGRLVAVKSEHRARSLINEIDFLLRLDHKNVVKTMGCDAQRTLIVLEFCPWGDLKTFIRRNMSNKADETTQNGQERSERRLSFSNEDVVPISNYLATLQTKLSTKKRRFNHTNVANNNFSSKTLDRANNTCAFHVIDKKRLMKWTLQLSDALAYLESLHVVHGDLALRNVLLTHNDLIRLTDFSMARDLDTTHTADTLDTALPWTHLAPECLKSPSEFSLKSDIWALGITIWELYSLADDPYSNLSTSEEVYEFLCSGQRLKTPYLAPPVIVRALRIVFNESPELRPNASSVKHMLINDRSEDFIGEDPEMDRRLSNFRTDYNTFTHRTFNEIVDNRDDVVGEGAAVVGASNVCYWNGYKIIGKDAQLRREQLSHND